MPGVLNWSEIEWSFPLIAASAFNDIYVMVGERTDIPASSILNLDKN